MGILLPTSAGRFVWRPGSFSLIPTCCTRRSCLIIRRGSICFRTFDTLSWTSCIPIVESSEVLLSRCAWTSLVIRALAAGALTDTVERHPVSLKRDNPITSAQGYATDVEHARIFRALVRRRMGRKPGGSGSALLHRPDIRFDPGAGFLLFESPGAGRCQCLARITTPRSPGQTSGFVARTGISQHRRGMSDDPQQGDLFLTWRDQGQAGLDRFSGHPQKKDGPRVLIVLGL